MKVCKIRGCGRKRLAHGLCSTHEMRRRAGAPLDSSKRPHENRPDRLVRRVRAMAASGNSQRGIAARLGIPRTTVQHWIHGTRRRA